MPSRPALRRLLLLLGALLSTGIPGSAASLEVEQVDLTVRLDPRFQALYATARFELRNRSSQPLEVIEFNLADTVAARVRYSEAWDREGELDWWKEDGGETKPPALRVALRRPLLPGKKVTLGVRYELAFQTAAASAPASVTAEGAQLATTGWYPLPAGAEPRRLRLAVRVPKDWQVSAPVALKKSSDGTALATYELEMKDVVPSKLLLRAERRTAAPP